MSFKRLLAAALVFVSSLAFGTDTFNVLDGSPLSVTTLRAGDGTLSAPSYSFTSDSGAGMYRAGANQIGFSGGTSGGFQFGVAVPGGIAVTTTGVLGFLPAGNILTTPDLSLSRDGAGTLAQRNSTNAQTFRVYNTFTDASNHERGFSRWASNVYEIGDEAAGTGTARAMKIRSGSGVLTISPTGTGANQLAAIQTTVPTVTTNGGTSPVCVGSDTAMVCTIGTLPPAAATFTVTFNGTWAAAPSCIAMRGTTGTTPLVAGVVAGTSTVVVNLSANLVASEKYNIQCMGIQ